MGDMSVSGSTRARWLTGIDQCDLFNPIVGTSLLCDLTSEALQGRCARTL